MRDIEKVKNLLIKLDLKYKATKDQTNLNGIILLMNFDKEYKEFNTTNALDVLNNLENKLAITEKALELAVETMRYELGREAIKNLNKDAIKNLKDNLNMKFDTEMCEWFIEQAKGMLKND